jgi:hypothetical protein
MDPVQLLRNILGVREQYRLASSERSILSATVGIAPGAWRGDRRNPALSCTGRGHPIPGAARHTLQKCSWRNGNASSRAGQCRRLKHRKRGLVISATRNRFNQPGRTSPSRTLSASWSLAPEQVGRGEIARPASVSALERPARNTRPGDPCIARSIDRQEPRAVPS